MSDIRTYHDICKMEIHPGRYVFVSFGMFMNYNDVIRVSDTNAGMFMEHPDAPPGLETVMSFEY